MTPSLKQANDVLNVMNDFISVSNQLRYEEAGDLQKLRHEDCPYSYYSEALGREYFHLVGGQVGTTECPGSPDLLGIISGGWFLQPYTSGGSATPSADWGITVVLGADNVVQVNGENWTVRTELGQPSFADPEAVITEHCYEHYSHPISYTYLQLRSGMEMGWLRARRVVPRSSLRTIRSTIDSAACPLNPDQPGAATLACDLTRQPSRRSCG